MKTLKKSLLGIVSAFTLCACGGGGNESLPNFINEQQTAEIVPAPLADGSGWVLVDRDGKQLSKKYAEIGYLHEGLAVFAQTEANDSTVNGRKLYGYLDHDGKVAIEPVYASASGFSDGLAWVSKPDSTLVAIDKNGTVKLRLPQAVSAIVFINGYAVWLDVCNNVFVIDKNGNNIELPKNIESISQYIDKYFFAKTDEGNKLFTIKDNIVSEVETLAQYELSESRYTGNDVFIVHSGDNYGLINIKGEYVVNPQYPKMSSFKNLYAFKNGKDKIGLLNKKGEEVIPAKFKDLKWTPTDSKYIIASTNGSRYNVYDMKGEVVGNGKYDDINSISPTLFAVKKDGKYGILDATTGELCCTPQFSQISNIGNIIFAGAGDSYAVINKEGKILSEEVYSDLGTWERNTEARTDYLSADQASALIKTMIDDLPLNVNAETMASKIGVSKSSLSTSDAFAEIKEFAYPSLYGNLYAQFTRPPLVSRGYRGGTAWNRNSSPSAYFITIMFDNDARKCGDVVKILADRYHINYFGEFDFESFSGCSAVQITKDANTGYCTMEPFIFDY